MNKYLESAILLISFGLIFIFVSNGLGIENDSYSEDFDSSLETDDVYFGILGYVFFFIGIICFIRYMIGKRK